MHVPRSALTAPVLGLGSQEPLNAARSATEHRTARGYCAS